MSEADTLEREVRIRAQAYQLWEDAGRPEGQSDYFWYRAQDLVRAKELDQGLPSNRIVNSSDRETEFEQKKNGQTR